jgi:hypothetical protein
MGQTGGLILQPFGGFRIRPTFLSFSRYIRLLA